MRDRDRLAADLRKADDEWMEDCNEPGPHWTVFIADRLIALGWTRLDEERLARALRSDSPWKDDDAFEAVWLAEAAAIAKAYREDEG